MTSAPSALEGDATDLPAENNASLGCKIATFYKFASLSSEETLRLKSDLLSFLSAMGVLGTIIIAQEGINGTVAGTTQGIHDFYQFMHQMPKFSDIIYKEMYEDKMPFSKLKVKIKPEIVSFGIDINSSPGEYVAPEDWDAMIASKDVLLIDGRNDYEYHVGTFRGAVNTNTKSFHEFPQWAAENLCEVDRNRPIATFCTGGVRCEKSTSYLKDMGFKNVYHLYGGIVNYFLRTSNKNNQWLGNCFIFDDRVIINDGLKSHW